jgi:hypothetical protein
MVETKTAEARKNNERLNCSPFDDPIVGACFKDAETAGEAVRSFANSVTKKDGIVIAKVNTVTPQSYFAMNGERGTRVDVKSKTDTNQDIILEVNMYTDKTIHQRNFLAVSQIITHSSVPGTTNAEMAKLMPHVICINILDYNMRTDNDDWLQPAKFVYTKPPHTVALPQYVSYDIELKKFKNAEPDWNDSLYCWISALIKARDERRSIKEVVQMTPQLQDFAATDMGFGQFSDRYELIYTSEEVQNEYHKWRREIIRQQGLLDGAREEGEEIGLQKGRKEGEEIGLQKGEEIGLQKGRKKEKKKRDVEISQNLMKLGRPIEEIMEAT